MIIIDGLFVLLAAACLGFLAYGGWHCVRHALAPEREAWTEGRSPRTADARGDDHLPIPLE
ncbi:MAG: hypothetical protein KJ025_01610 [Burkholderiales bacterium]|nr:hypothetical protein [Burkholderiales bacterium]